MELSRRQAGDSLERGTDRDGVGVHRLKLRRVKLSNQLGNHQTIAVGVVLLPSFQKLRNVSVDESAMAAVSARVSHGSGSSHQTIAERTRPLQSSNEPKADRFCAGRPARHKRPGWSTRPPATRGGSVEPIREDRGV